MNDAEALASLGTQPIIIFGLEYPSPLHAYHASKYLTFNINRGIVETSTASLIRADHIVNDVRINQRWAINKNNIIRYIIFTFLTTYYAPVRSLLSYYFLTDYEPILETLSVLDNKLMPLSPTANSNWNIPGRLMSSASPSIQNIQSLVKAGVNIIINLREVLDPNETNFETHLGFKYSVDPNGQYVTFHLPIHDHSITYDSHIIKMAILIIHLIGLDKCVMVHCHGGKGRTGTLVSIVLGILYGLNKDQALAMITRHYKSRIDKGYLQILHITPIQILQIDRVLKQDRHHLAALLN